jgi:hypothetical protein
LNVISVVDAPVQFVLADETFTLLAL